MVDVCGAAPVSAKHLLTFRVLRSCAFSNIVVLVSVVPFAAMSKTGKLDAPKPDLVLARRMPLRNFEREVSGLGAGVYDGPGYVGDENKAGPAAKPRARRKQGRGFTEGKQRVSNLFFT